MVKRKMIIIANVDEAQEPGGIRGIRYAIEQAFSDDVLTVDLAIDTSFIEENDYNITALAIEGDIENKLENEGIDPTPELIAKWSYEVSISDELSNRLSDAVDEVFTRMKRERKL